MKILAVSVGLPQKVRWQNKEVLTSIFKSPVEGAVRVNAENIEGDRQADLTVHGGFDKAVYAYSHDTYPWWQEALKVDSLPYGSFGENLTMETLDETRVFVGDVFAVGECQFEAVQPRMPCFKLGIKFGDLKIIQTFYEYDRCGVYFRVKKPGLIQAGDSMKLLSSESVKVSIAELFHFIKNKGVTSKRRAAEIAAIPSLNEKWRSKFIQISQSEEE